MLRELIRNARRRLLFNEALKQFAFSGALAIGGLAVLLTVGTRYLEWWVLASFAAAVCGWAAVKLRKRLPGDYVAAVWLDDKAGLHDALSTAHYFATSTTKLTPEAEAILLAQREQAESVAGGVNVAAAVPFRFPRALYGLGALLLVSSGLVGLRYFYGHGLNLRAPITEVIFQDLAATKSQGTRSSPLSGKPASDYEEAESLLSKLGLGTDIRKTPNEDLDQALANALQAANPAGDDSSPDAGKPDPIEPSDAQNNPSKDSQPQPGDAGQPNTSDQKGSDQSGKKPDQNDKSLLSKLKEAMDNLMGSPGEAADQKSDPQKSKSDQSPSGTKEGQSGQGDNKSPAESEAAGDAQKSPSAGQSAGNKPDAPSVAGAEDGEKAAKESAQLKAMGKISELIGKRSGQVTGESMIEVESGDQKLRTAYKDKSAAHGEGTGEVGRDQIPLSVQEYVQEYFQQVRKPAAPRASRTGDASASP